MQISIDLSLYPLAEQAYKNEIWTFINALKANSQVKVVSNGMSTQVFGEYDHTLGFVMAEMKKVHQTVGSAVFILKIIADDRFREYDN
ncbi:hypothetical protein DXX93_10755 [Thalassotalea euphylliae]|uniref:Thiamin/hydroxymethyl pyrimidine-binding YkoF putative domain-containing protein n=1 Tax=Thalassotalea euphylliae TaxID=1655234 RepID=A0A3E0TWC6_9GAMM|nr:hypothetical protein [Thalassotalea euphylliae]REL28898.1 hypothetical protein DXX93_10755 [Thalassotalea euphylliae]